MISSRVTPHFRWGHWGTEKSGNLPWIPWLICSGGSRTLKCSLLTTLCMAQSLLAIFITILCLDFGILDVFLPSSVSNLSCEFYHSRGFLSCLSRISPMRQMRLALEFEDDTVLLCDPLLGLHLTTEAGDDNGNHVRCIPEGLRCHFIKH